MFEKKALVTLDNLVRSGDYAEGISWADKSREGVSQAQPGNTTEYIEGLHTRFGSRN